MPSVVPPQVVASKVKSELRRPALAARIVDLVYQAKGAKQITLYQAHMKSLRHFADLVKDLVSEEALFPFVPICILHDFCTIMFLMTKCF